MQLTEAQADAVKRAAARRGVSMAEVLRMLIDDHLDEVSGDDRRERALRVIGRHRSGVRDVSRAHDRELGEAFAR